MAIRWGQYTWGELGVVMVNEAVQSVRPLTHLTKETWNFIKPSYSPVEFIYDVLSPVSYVLIALMLVWLPIKFVARLLLSPFIAGLYIPIKHWDAGDMSYFQGVVYGISHQCAKLTETINDFIRCVLILPVPILILFIKIPLQLTIVILKAVFKAIFFPEKNVYQENSDYEFKCPDFYPFFVFRYFESARLEREALNQQPYFMHVDFMDVDFMQLDAAVRGLQAQAAAQQARAQALSAASTTAMVTAVAAA